MATGRPPDDGSSRSSRRRRGKSAPLGGLEALGKQMGETGTPGSTPGSGSVPAGDYIEVKVTPERGGGFNRFAERIARFDEVESCYLMSGGYDLLVFVKGPSLQKVAAFVSEKLSSVEGVLSTSTHFMLRCYKEQGFLLDGGDAPTTRLTVAP